MFGCIAANETFNNRSEITNYSLSYGKLGFNFNIFILKILCNYSELITRKIFIDIFMPKDSLIMTSILETRKIQTI